jgi:hypothetical protein
LALEGKDLEKTRRRYEAPLEKYKTCTNYIYLGPPNKNYFISIGPHYKIYFLGSPPL